MKTSKRAAVLVATALAAVLGAASFAWACTIQARVGAINPSSGPSDTRVTVRASEFNPGAVEIRWNSTSGRVLGTANGPSFSVTVVIPQATPGVYSVVAVQRSGGSIVGKASAAFEVTPATATEYGGYSSGPSGRGDQSGPTGTAAEGETGTAGSTSPSEQSSPNSGDSSQGQRGSSSYGSGAAFPAEPNPISQDSAPAAAGQLKAPARTASGSVAWGAPIEAIGVGASAPAVAPERDEDEVSPHNGLADLWSGFENGSIKADASLTQGDPGNTSPAPLMAGAWVISLGLMALFGGFSVAEMQRRRALVNSNSR